MRPVEKFIRFLGKLVVFCFAAGLVLYFMQTKIIWLYFTFAGVFLIVPYMFLGVLIALGTSGTMANQKSLITEKTSEHTDFSEEELISVLHFDQEQKKLQTDQ